MTGLLPRDVVLSILRRVDDARTLSACQRVNKAWCELVVQNRLWESPFVGFDWRLFLDFTGLFDVALNSSLLEWFRAVDKSVWAPVWDLEWAQAADRTMSVVLEGIEGAGKSSCVVQFVNGIFVESYDPVRRTHVCYFLLVIVLSDFALCCRPSRIRTEWEWCLVRHPHY